jgi:hypothetical protein
MKVFDFPQGSPEWLQVRCGVPTASEFDNIMKLDFTMKGGEGYKTYLYKKVAEAITGPLPSFGSRDTDRGHFLEPEAVPFFEMETGLDVHTVGFVMSDDGRSGCSPDGLVGEDSGLEIKSPGAVNQVRYLIDGKLPNDYSAQVHGSLYVTGRKEWHFMSYHRKLPKFHLVVKRDEEIMAKIGKCIAAFCADFDAAIEKIEPRKLTE